MPVFTYEPRTANDKSSLTPGMHPAFLLAIWDEEVPDGWQMKEKSPRLWRWRFAVYQDVQSITGGAVPEKQSATSSQTFSPGGKYQPSKAYLWTCRLVGHKIQPGESIDLDPLLPLPCQLLVSRIKADGLPMEYANVKDLEPWPEGAQYLTPEFKSLLMQVARQAPPESQGPTARAPGQDAPPGQTTSTTATTQPGGSTTRRW